MIGRKLSSMSYGEWHAGVQNTAARKPCMCLAFVQRMCWKCSVLWKVGMGEIKSYRCKLARTYCKYKHD
jgi:hypothetical protein